MVTPTDIESQRLCVVSIEYDNIKVLLICVYMPYDAKRPNQNIIEYKSVLNNIIILCNGANANYVIVGGGCNTDLSGTYFTRLFYGNVLDIKHVNCKMIYWIFVCKELREPSCINKWTINRLSQIPKCRTDTLEKHFLFCFSYHKRNQTIKFSI